MKLNGKAFAISFFLTLLGAAVAWALTSDQIWHSVYDSVQNAIRVVQI